MCKGDPEGTHLKNGGCRVGGDRLSEKSHGGYPVIFKKSVELLTGRY